MRYCDNAGCPGDATTRRDGERGRMDLCELCAAAYDLGFQRATKYRRDTLTGTGRILSP